MYNDCVAGYFVELRRLVVKKWLSFGYGVGLTESRWFQIGLCHPQTLKGHFKKLKKLRTNKPTNNGLVLLQNTMLLH